jgi:succinate dehydrogenase hydrophobic anchor subunit
MYPKKYYSNFYLYIIPLLFVLALIILAANRIEKDYMYGRWTALTAVVFFSLCFCALLYKFVQGMSVITLSYEKLEQRSILYNSKFIVCLNNVVSLNVERFDFAAKKFSYRFTTSESSSSQQLIFSFEDGTQKCLSIDNYLDSDEIIAEIRKNIESRS